MRHIQLSPIWMISRIAEIRCLKYDWVNHCRDNLNTVMVARWATMLRIEQLMILAKIYSGQDNWNYEWQVLNAQIAAVYGVAFTVVISAAKLSKMLPVNNEMSSRLSFHGSIYLHTASQITALWNVVEYFLVMLEGAITRAIKGLLAWRWAGSLVYTCAWAAWPKVIGPQ